jgi:hypothetical protein
MTTKFSYSNKRVSQVTAVQKGGSGCLPESSTTTAVCFTVPDLTACQLR